MGKKFKFKGKSKKSKKDKRSLAEQMSDFTKTSGTAVLHLTSIDDAIEPIFVCNVSLYGKGHENNKQSHNILLKVQKTIEKKGIDFDLSKLNVSLRGGWSDLFARPDVSKQAGDFFAIDDFQAVLDKAVKDADDDVDDIDSTLANIRDEIEESKSFNDQNTGYLNIYLDFDGVSYRLKDLPMLGISNWEAVIKSYLLYQTIKNPKAQFKDFMDDFSFEITELRLTKDLKLGDDILDMF